MEPLLFAIEGDAPVALPIGPRVDGATGDANLYQGFELGVYSSLRTFEHRKFLDLEHHLARTRSSMARLGWRYAWDEQRLRRCLDAVCSNARFEEMRVRFDVLAAPGIVRGTQSRELIALTAFTPPAAELYDVGVSVLTTNAIQRDNPLAKVASFVQRRHAIEVRAPTAYEHLIVNAEGEILEGLSSNFFAVCGGVLYTAGNNVLEGVTRRIVLQCAHELAIPVRLSAPRADAIAQLDEAAISSSSRGLLAVVSIDERPVAQGVPGPIMHALRGAYDAYVTRHVRPAV